MQFVFFLLNPEKKCEQTVINGNRNGNFFKLIFVIITQRFEERKHLWWNWWQLRVIYWWRRKFMRCEENLTELQFIHWKNEMIKKLIDVCVCVWCIRVIFSHEDVFCRSASCKFHKSNWAENVNYYIRFAQFFTALLHINDTFFWVAQLTFINLQLTITHCVWWMTVSFDGLEALRLD